MPNTPFFPAFRAFLAPMGKRVREIRQKNLLQLDILFSSFCPPGMLSQSDEGPNSRDRIYSLRRTFFGFLYQTLNPQCACREVVRQLQALFAPSSSRQISSSTGAYCQARARLPLELLQRMRCALAARATQAEQLWHGFRVKVIDGTSVSMPDTPQNQRAYPQPAGQKRGCGFPWLKLVAVFSLQTGVLLDYARGNKHQHELKLLRRLMAAFKPGDLALADRGFSSYTLMALLFLKKVPCVFRLHHGRSHDMRQGKRLGKQDRLVTWKKPENWQRRYLSEAVWRSIPTELSVRILRFSLSRPGYRNTSVTLVTTLLDPKQYPAEQIALLYARRWQIELWFRDIKTSMGMEVLRCQTPAMIRKELEMHFIAYNLIRCLMIEASRRYAVELSRISFQGTVDSVRQFAPALAQARSRKKQNEILQKLYEVMARDLVPKRPGRREPRAVKRRPKPCATLNKPRHKYKEVQHRNRYWKTKPRKTRA